MILAIEYDSCKSQLISNKLVLALAVST